ncbi:hypothetical protein FUT69_05980 [Xylella taiwanensis]|uniref:Uncharacterized protein n=1 Tax=Xylella taiwanensis TaxID=1444770 RepID=A0ABS8TUU8_9GAMM|nr:hypothetical protein [Xylella taiwanensis]MCD8456563.1 hypothetical protein [Xylella taiwanensis]MCD8458970.1 hypothetical protein [Xylella taiwanensis]MCD8461108.1 hypothetical protein [Xylella taiwanensis]MCD8462833.1 hypothetical protein [Xylella taiwanensis]MCD8465613.1 hypothetical protein [Xylella taiwanensis]
MLVKNVIGHSEYAILPGNCQGACHASKCLMGMSTIGSVSTEVMMKTSNHSRYIVNTNDDEEYRIPTYPNHFEKGEVIE